jgi:cyclophilin family peptidyl-prolyl cis-trans isomerase
VFPYGETSGIVPHDCNHGFPHVLNRWQTAPGLIGVQFRGGFEMHLISTKLFLSCVILAAAVLVLAVPVAGEDEKAEKNPVVVLSTTLGDIEIELFPKEAPITVKNFLWYVNNKFYNGLIFHRVMSGFMIQGGGFNMKMQRKEGNAPIKNEATNGLSNERGTIAMARTSVINSATSQFFINLVDNSKNLDHRDKSPAGYGYAVFGKVINGMDVVDKIAEVEVHSHMGNKNVPTDPIVIEKAYVVEEKKEKKKK